MVSKARFSFAHAIPHRWRKPTAVLDALLHAKMDASAELKYHAVFPRLPRPPSKVELKAETVPALFVSNQVRHQASMHGLQRNFAYAWAMLCNGCAAAFLFEDLILTRQPFGMATIAACQATVSTNSVQRPRYSEIRRTCSVRFLKEPACFGLSHGPTLQAVPLRCVVTSPPPALAGGLLLVVVSWRCRTRTRRL